GATVTCQAASIDVHIVNHEATGGRFSLPRAGGALTAPRRIAGFVVALARGPLTPWLLYRIPTDESIPSDRLSYQLLVVIVSLVGGIWPALFAALLSGFTLNFFFVDPLFNVTVDEPRHLAALVLYVLIAALVSYVVDQSARRTRAAKRAAAESELLATVSGSV